MAKQPTPKPVKPVSEKQFALDIASILPEKKVTLVKKKLLRGSFEDTVKRGKQH